MATFTETVHNLRDNTIGLALLENGAARADLSAITKAWLDIGGTVLKSEVVGATVIWWTDQAVYRGATVDVLKLKLGHQALTPGDYRDCVLTVFDPDHPNGFVWTRELRIEVLA